MGLSKTIPASARPAVSAGVCPPLSLAAGHAVTLAFTMTDLHVHDPDLGPFTMTDLGVHDGPI